MRIELEIHNIKNELLNYYLKSPHKYNLYYNKFIDLMKVDNNRFHSNFTIIKILLQDKMKTYKFWTLIKICN